MPDFSELNSEYTTLWASMDVRADKDELVTRIARKLLRHKARYQAVEAKTGVPWFVVAALHNRESDANFSTYLGNGEPLNRVTRLVPKGRGPFAGWQQGAIDALTLDGLDQVKVWTLERACFEIEKFNGFGYRRRGFPSPYLWSFSNHYARGKYIADGRFSATHVDQQCGALPIIKRIMEIDKSARFQAQRSILQSAPAMPPSAAPAGAAAAGGALGFIAHALGAHPAIVVAVVGAAIIAGAVLYVRARRSQRG